MYFVSMADLCAAARTPVAFLNLIVVIPNVGGMQG